MSALLVVRLQPLIQIGLQFSVGVFQLSPQFQRKRKSPWFPKGLRMERVRRVELPTLCLASIRSSQLSYTRVSFFLPEANSFVNLNGAKRAPNELVVSEKTASGN